MAAAAEGVHGALHDKKMLGKGHDDCQNEPLVDPRLDDEQRLPLGQRVERVEHLHGHEDGQGPVSSVTTRAQRKACVCKDCGKMVTV